MLLLSTFRSFLARRSSQDLGASETFLCGTENHLPYTAFRTDFSSTFLLSAAMVLGTFCCDGVRDLIWDRLANVKGGIARNSQEMKTHTKNKHIARTHPPFFS